ncbi:MAG: hypothetical protein GC159_06565 [Phycisphaera sp.]|nr:hypothetical protein [Phycisphaera sp.]
MGLFGFIKGLLGGGAGDPRKDPTASFKRERPPTSERAAPPRRRGSRRPRDIAALAAWIGVGERELTRVSPSYQTFFIPKRNGDRRRIDAPSAELKTLQRRINRKLLRRLKTHRAATGFERGRSIATNAAAHTGNAVVVQMDIRDFFPSTTTQRVLDYFRAIGWEDDAARLLVDLTTHEGGLPQGAPTSPRLSNLVNHQLDARLDRLAARCHAAYTRYADDITFSFADGDPLVVRRVIRATKSILAEHGYRIHHRRKLHIRRRHERQVVTGLVVNDRANLPRHTRRWLRAVEHRLMTTGSATLTESQLAGWRALRQMIDRERG